MNTSSIEAIRFARAEERDDLEALQRRASLVWESDRAQLLAHPDAIELPADQIDGECVRVAIAADGRVLGFSAVLGPDNGTSELDGLFVDPEVWGGGVGRALVEDAAALSRIRHAMALEVTANPNALGFYVRTGFVEIGMTTTRFGPGARMRLTLIGVD